MNYTSTRTKESFINSGTYAPITQKAYGLLNHKEESGFHLHKTMEEFFFITKRQELTTFI